MCTSWEKSECFLDIRCGEMSLLRPENLGRMRREKGTDLNIYQTAFHDLRCVWQVTGAVISFCTNGGGNGAAHVPGMKA